MSAMQRAPCGAGFRQLSRPQPSGLLGRLPPRCRRGVAAHKAPRGSAEGPQHGNGAGTGGGGGSGSGEPPATAAALRDLQTQLQAQQQQLAQALQLIQEQQGTIDRLRRSRSPSPLPPSKAAAAAADGGGDDDAAEQRPLDGPEAVLEPTPLERQVAGSYSGRHQAGQGSWGAARDRDLALLPHRIVLVRHAQSKGNVDPFQVL